MKEIYLAETASKVKRPLLEKDVQKTCVDWARARGYWARKFSSQSQRSVPDYLLSRRKGEIDGRYLPRPLKLACEFKAPGKTSTPAQIDEQELMRLAGWFVFECDNFDTFKRTVLAYEQEVA
jgi:hypothetical protein